MLALLVLALVAWYSRDYWERTTPLNVAELRARIEDWGVLAPLASLALMTLQSLFSPIPMALVVIANGAVFGTVNGVLLSALGELCGSTAAYGLARLGLAPSLTSSVMEQIRHRVNFWHLLGLRLIPGLSVDLVSYACGALRVNWPVFAVSTVLGLLPRTLLFAYFGEELLTNPQRTLLFTLPLIIPLWLLVFWKLRPDGSGRRPMGTAMAQAD